MTRIYSPILETARSIICSGNLDLLSSYELKNDIVSYVEKVDAKLINIIRLEESYFRKGKELILELMPNTFRSKEDYNKRLEEMPREDIKAYFESDFSNIPIDFDQVPFQTNFKELFQNEKFYLAYTKLKISHYNMYLMYGEILELTNELLEKLNNVKLLGDEIKIED